jgi:hypothetical protein
VGADDRIGQAVMELSTFSEGLESIRSTLTEGVALMRASDEQRREETSAAPKTQEAAPLPQQVVVQHKVPRVVLGVVKSQFQLMQNWLGPILAAESEQAGEMQQLRKSVEKCLDEYSKMIEELEAAKNPDVPPDTLDKPKS